MRIHEQLAATQWTQWVKLCIEGNLWASVIWGMGSGNYCHLGEGANQVNLRLDSSYSISCGQQRLQHLILQFVKTLQANSLCLQLVKTWHFGIVGRVSCHPKASRQVLTNWIFWGSSLLSSLSSSLGTAWCLSADTFIRTRTCFPTELSCDLFSFSCDPLWGARPPRWELLYSLPPTLLYLSVCMSLSRFCFQVSAC